MRTAVLAYGLAVLLPLGYPGFAVAQSLSGTFTGVIAETPSTLMLEQAGDALTGQLDSGGYVYHLEGTVEDASAGGMLTDIQTGAILPFDLEERTGFVTLAVLSSDPYGQLQRVEFRFERDDARSPVPPVEPAAPSMAGAPSTAQPPAAAQPPSGAPSTSPQAAMRPETEQFERDPALVGAWSYSDTYISGDFSATTRLFMQVNADGSYAYGSGGVSAGMDNNLGSVYGNSGSGDVTRGEWRTEGGIVYIREPGAPGWTPYARYYVEGASMMFTFANGERQVWHRR